MEAREIESTITKARELASLSDYDGALELYSSMDQEIDNQTHFTTGLIKSRWEALRTELGSEVQLIREVQAQLRLFVSPADAARVDYPRRVKTTIDDCAREAPRYGGVATRGTKPYVRTRSAVHDTVPSEPDVGKINQVLYGDKDKFGPDVPNTAPQRGRWWPNGGQRANPAPAAHPKPARRISHIHNSETNTTVSQLNGGSSNQASARVRTDRVKPPVPQFQRRDGPSQPSAPANRKNTNASKFVKNPAVEGLTGRAPFVPRAGDEELTSIIQADILLGDLNVRWDDVAGLDEAKESLKEAMVLPLLLPDFFQGCRQPHKGILMYGPPGTGKTMLAKAASTQCETTFFNVSPTTLASKWRGDSERMVRVLFEMARHYAPSTIFIDEIDALCSQRTSSEHEATRRMKTEILTQIDGVQSISGSGTDQKLVIVLGATNMPWEIDEGFLRRLSKRIYIPLPNLSSRAELLKITTKGINVGEDVHFEELAKHMENYSGSDIAAICKEASLMALRRLSEGLRVEDIKQRATELQKELCQLPLSQADFSTAMKRVRSSVNHTHIVKYEKWTQEFGCM